MQKAWKNGKHKSTYKKCGVPVIQYADDIVCLPKLPQLFWLDHSHTAASSLAPSGSFSSACVVALAA